MPSIDLFLPSWQHARELTYDFIACVPEDRWAWSPHTRYADFNKQVRHMVCVQGVYIDGLLHRESDFGNKHSHYSGDLDRQNLTRALHDMDDSLAAALAEVRSAGEDDFTIDFYGEQRLGSYLNVFLHHEALHHGQWSFYATLGGFQTPQSWRFNWGL